uniref:Uncharacterized protein n=1 Tax=Aegilops tauschii subsp. strangulata TaxID=200361 RepID=A0A453T4R4_AEGTS
LSTLNSTTYTKIAWDKKWQTFRKVPCWSHFLQPEQRCRSPLPLSVDVPYVDGYPSPAHPELLDVLIETPGLKRSTKEHHLSYLSFAPPELSFDKFQADEQGWVDTIKSVNSGGMVRISTMDWLGQSQYASETVFWPSLSSAISEGNILQECNREAARSLLDTLHPEHREVLEEPPVLKHPLHILQIQPLRRQGRGQVLLGSRVQRDRTCLGSRRPDREPLPRLHPGEPWQVRRQRCEGEHRHQQPHLGLLLHDGWSELRNVRPLHRLAAARRLRCGLGFSLHYAR